MDNKNYYSCVSFYEIETLKPAQGLLKIIINTYEKIPIIKYLDDPGYYICLFFILITIIIRKKKEILPMLPLFLTFLSCLAGPAMDYHGRYAFPIIFSIFPLIAFYSKLYLEEPNENNLGRPI